MLLFIKLGVEIRGDFRLWFEFVEEIGIGVIDVSLKFEVFFLKLYLFLKFLGVEVKKGFFKVVFISKEGIV